MPTDTQIPSLPLPVTAWFRWTPPEKPKAGRTPKPGYWSFNHLEATHVEAPKPSDPFGRGWHSAQWRKCFGELVQEGSRYGAPVLNVNTNDVFDGEPMP